MTEFRVEIATAPKAGNTDAENEDVARYSASSGGLRAAIADGATESSYATEWATAIVDTWTAGVSLVDLWAQSRSTWLSRVPARETLPWFAQTKLDDGSAAATVLLEVRTTPRGYRWSTASIGDSELFVLSGRRRSTSLVRALPVQASALFSNTPPLARTSFDQPWVGHAGAIRGPAELWLATDALAKALLEAKELGRPSWGEWSEAIWSPNDFRECVEVWRGSGRLKNDDTTLLRLRLP